MTILTKDPSAVLDYQINWADPLGTDTISTSAWTATGGVVVDSDSFTDTTATVVISSGVRQATCEAVNTIITTAGHTHQSTAVIRIMDV